VKVVVYRLTPVVNLFWQAHRQAGGSLPACHGRQVGTAGMPGEEGIVIRYVWMAVYCLVAASNISNYSRHQYCMHCPNVNWPSTYLAAANQQQLAGLLAVVLSG